MMTVPSQKEALIFITEVAESPKWNLGPSDCVLPAGGVWTQAKDEIGLFI